MAFAKKYKTQKGICYRAHITNNDGIWIEKDISLINIDNIISITGTVRSSANVIIFIPYMDEDGYKCLVLFDNGVIKMSIITSQLYFGRTAYITIEYTKTTN